MKLNLRGKTILIIVFTSLVALIVAGIIINWRVNQAFNTFLSGQFRFLEDQGMLPMGPTAPIRKLQELRQDRLHIDLENIFQKQVWRGIASAAILAAGGAVLIGLFWTEKILHPLNVLKQNIHKLKKHKYDEALPKLGDEEIEQVAKSFEELRKELLRVEELRKDVISDMAHEITTPLQSLLGSIEGIEEGIYQGPEQAKAMKQDVDRIRSLVDDMRLFSHSRAKTRKLNLDKINLHDFVQEHLKTLIKQAEGKGLKFENNITPTAILQSDQVTLAQILTNLFKNAIDFTDKGKIAISAQSIQDKKENNVTSIKIEDTGIGIDQKHIPYIFERFYRADKSRNRKTGGTGLGLAIVKEYIDQLGWAIEVESQIGKGSIFKIITE